MAAATACDDIPLNGAARCAEAFGGRYIGLEEAAPKGTKTAVVFLTRHDDLPHAVAAANRLAEAGVDVVAVDMNVPSCLKDVTPAAWQIEAWQYDELALAPVMELLKKGK